MPLPTQADLLKAPFLVAGDNVPLATKSTVASVRGYSFLGDAIVFAPSAAPPPPALVFPQIVIIS